MTYPDVFLHLANLLRYPDEDLKLLGEELGRHNHPNLTETSSFLEYMANTPLLDMQADFVRYFDLNPAGSLYLTSHAYGNSPLQGRALAAFTELYRDAGCEPPAEEMPDYLPLVLEFMAVAPPWATSCLCEKFTPTVCGISDALEQTQSPWAGLLRAAAHVMGACAPTSEEPV
ncbi:MAG: nitrate reductase molybdenum cofactor assembly chaperone [Desulfovibrio sp.]|nr:nitrate reductase molybdenum cofactor assembly chaperone [Desulfovibrio sp.]